jgi:hypothetical protein
MSRSVRALPPPEPAVADSSRKLPRADDTIVGMVRTSVMMPAARTAPAPM